MNLSEIVWRDIFKPRYALIVEVDRMPVPPKSPDGTNPDFNDFSKWQHVMIPVIRQVPRKRPLTMPFNVFYNKISKENDLKRLHFCGSYRTLRKLYGIGSCEKHNMKNAVVQS